MRELTAINNYTELKETLREEINNQALGFVRTGYLLKKARDTGIIQEGGYHTVFEFAKAEYGLSKDIVSRYIAINDRYSEGGYSDKLQEQYQEYGIAKLQDMLTLPMEVVGILSPDMTRREIGEVKAEVKAEEAITPLELIAEGSNRQQADMDVCERMMHQYIYENREEIKSLAKALFATTNKDDAVKAILDAMAPSGVGVKHSRPPGDGRIMISFRGDAMPIVVLCIRSREQMTLQWDEFIEKMRNLFPITPETDLEEYWSKVYGEEFQKKEPKKEEKPEVAPVQQTKPLEQKKSAGWKSKYNIGDEVRMTDIPYLKTGILKKKREHKGDWLVQIGGYTEIWNESYFKIYEPEPEKEVMNPPAEQTGADQVPGQRNIKDYPEYMPEPEVIPPEQTEVVDTATEEPVSAAVEPKTEESDPVTCMNEENMQVRTTDESDDDMAAGEPDMMQTIILEQIDALKRSVMSRSWQQAKMDIEMITDSIDRAKNM